MIKFNVEIPTLMRISEIDTVVPCNDGYMFCVQMEWGNDYPKDHLAKFFYFVNRNGIKKVLAHLSDIENITGRKIVVPPRTMSPGLRLLNDGSGSLRQNKSKLQASGQR